MSSAANHEKRAHRGRTPRGSSIPTGAVHKTVRPKLPSINPRSFGERIKKAVREAETSYTEQGGEQE